MSIVLAKAARVAPDRRRTSDGIGWSQRFQKGSIYWTPTSGTRAIYGALHTKWVALGSEKSVLGYPTTHKDHRPNPSTPGRRPLEELISHNRLGQTM